MMRIVSAPLAAKTGAKSRTCVGAGVGGRTAACVSVTVFVDPPQPDTVAIAPPRAAIPTSLWQRFTRHTSSGMLHPAARPKPDVAGVLEVRGRFPAPAPVLLG